MFDGAYRRHGLRCVLVAWLSVLPCTPWASIDITLGVEDIQHETWQAQGIAFRINENDQRELSLAITFAQLVLPDEQGVLTSAEFSCAAMTLVDTTWRCEQGKLSIGDSPLGAQETTWTGSFSGTDDFELNVAKLVLGSGSVALELSGVAGQWRAKLDASRLPIAQLQRLPKTAALLPRDWGVKGTLSADIEAAGEAGEPQSLSGNWRVAGISYGSPDGLQAAEKLQLSGRLTARAVPGGSWKIDASADWPQGALYSDPLYLDAQNTPIKASIAAVWTPDAGQWQLDNWSVDAGSALKVSGTGLWDDRGQRFTNLVVAAVIDDAGALYRGVLQPFMIGTAADELEMAGRVGLVLHFDEQGIEQAGLELNQLAMDDKRGRFGLGSTTGSVAWDRDQQVPASKMAVGGASIYGIPTGEFAINAQFAGDRFELLEPVVVPVAGGALALDAFALNGVLMAGAPPSWTATASLRDVSLEQLTTMLEWPPFGGEINGQLREMHYADKVFSIGGGLELQAFDGMIRVAGLKIRDPLGSLPVLTADAQLDGLDLTALTQTYSFGRIDGRLDGTVSNIELAAWQPVGFKLHLFTPQDDDSRHRISQRAVENLTELGSGIPAGLSATVLRIFDDFRYDAIDVRIALKGNVATLDGLARPDGGYYLVKGAGLPRIDVIGRNRSVAWKDLVERLQQIQVEGATIE